MALYAGTSGLVLPLTKKAFPPEYRQLSRLEYYATLYNSIEINNSFYKIPQAKTIEKWVSLVPDDFRFTFKIFKGITHNKGLQFEDEMIGSFMKAVTPATIKAGCLLIQLPPSLKIEKLNELQQLLSALSFYNTNAWVLAVEFRDPSWYERETIEIMTEFNACMVLQDIPASATPPDLFITSEIYLRFHGPSGNYRGEYDSHFLQQKAAFIKKQLKVHKTVYAYFNNTIGAANRNLDELIADIR